MRGRSADEQTAAYHALRDELAELGFTDRVLRSLAQQSRSQSTSRSPSGVVARLIADPDEARPGI